MPANGEVPSSFFGDRADLAERDGADVALRVVAQADLLDVDAREDAFGALPGSRSA